jgi:putative tricarboxylic transport membrane protein
MTARLVGVTTALAFLLLGSGQIHLSLRLPGGIGASAAEPGPGLFPLLVGVLMCASAVLHLIQASLAADSGDIDLRRGARDIGLLLASIAAYIVLLPRVGFALSAFLLLLATLSLFGMAGAWRRLGMAALVTLVAFMVFTMLLGVKFPAPTWAL